MKYFDYIIAGQGIAGTMLSWFLIREGKKVLVVDEKKENTSSRIAPGMFNPVTGRMLMKTWKADEIFPFAANTYRELEQEQCPHEGHNIADIDRALLVKQHRAAIETQPRQILSNVHQLVGRRAEIGGRHHRPLDLADDAPGDAPVPTSDEPDPDVHPVQFVAAAADFVAGRAEVLGPMAVQMVEAVERLPSFFTWLEAHAEKMVNRDMDAMQYQIKRCAELLRIEESGLNNLVNKFIREKVTKQENIQQSQGGPPPDP